MVHEINQLEEGEVDESQVLSDYVWLVAQVSGNDLANDVDLLREIHWVAILKVSADLVVEIVVYARHHVCLGQLLSVATEKLGIVFLGDVLHDCL